MQVKLEHPACMPVRTNPTDAGLDLRAKITYGLPINKRVLVGTGVSVKIPVNHVGLLFPRSSLSKSGIVMTNSVGVIDSDYRGEIMASLMFQGVAGNCTCYELQAGERIVQLVVVPILLPDMEIMDWSDDLWYDTKRGEGGFGSTGRI